MSLVSGFVVLRDTSDPPSVRAAYRSVRYVTVLLVCFNLNHLFQHIGHSNSFQRCNEPQTS
jgi:hypothetical protein